MQTPYTEIPHPTTNTTSLMDWGRGGEEVQRGRTTEERWYKKTKYRQKVEDETIKLCKHFHTRTFGYDQSPVDVRIELLLKN